MDYEIFHIVMRILAFLFGACIGSFSNVLIHRLPLEESIVFPGSHCPKCNHKIPFYENIPLLSFIFLKGKCSKCNEKISSRYFFVELICASMAFILFPKDLSMPSVLLFFFYFFIFASFLVDFIIDFKHQILPDSIALFLAILFVTYSIYELSWVYSLLGAGIGFGLPFLISFAFYKLRGKIGLGGGDIKLYGALGILLGVQGVMLNIFLSCLLGALVGIALILLRKMTKDTPLAFGPFIILVAFIQIFFPDFLPSDLLRFSFGN